MQNEDEVVEQLLAKLRAAGWTVNERFVDGSYTLHVSRDGKGQVVVGRSRLDVAKSTLRDCGVEHGLDGEIEQST